MTTSTVSLPDALADVPRVDLPGVRLSATFAADLPELALPWAPTPLPDEATPTLVVLRQDVAASVGLDAEVLRSRDGVAVLAGAAVPSGATPVAMGYAGHQFGSYSPRLGDGRALLLGELVVPGTAARDSTGTASGARTGARTGAETDEGATDRRVDLHLKGSGRTPWARGGDGRGTLASMLRELVVAEAMHALGVPTTRALAAVATGATVPRERGPEPGGVLARVASSHLRVGSVQYAAALREPGLLRRLVDHTLARHHPQLLELPPGERAVALLDEVVGAQAALVARWMALGFVHGVMNTDNTALSGETIDYGPCAFLEAHDPATVFSSIDHAGRYAFGNQPRMAQWNLLRLAEALLPAMGDGRDVVEVVDGELVRDEAAEAAATEVIATFPDRYRDAWLTRHREKLGLVQQRDGDDRLVEQLLDGLHAASADHTGAFRSLAATLRGDPAPWRELADVEPLRRWHDDWRARLTAEGRDLHAAADAMDAVNPEYVPRNHLVEEVLEASRHGDHGPVHRLLDVVTDPYTARPEHQRYADPAPAGFTEGYRTYCGT